MGFTIRRVDPLVQSGQGRRIYGEFKEYTMIPEELYIENLRILFDNKQVQGSIVECGVWKGGMIAGIARLLPTRRYYLFDSFEGLPKAREIDGESAINWQRNKKGDFYYNNCSADIHFAEEAMRKTAAEYTIIKGWFEDTLKNQEFVQNIAFLRLDGDWYDSTMLCLDALYPKVVKGGIVILDDYLTWDGCSKAVHDYLHKNDSSSKILISQKGVPYIKKLD